MECKGGRTPTDPHVEAAVLELPVLLAQRAVLAAPMHEEVRAVPFLEVVVRPHLGPVHARVQATHPRRRADRRVSRSAPGTRCAKKSSNHMTQLQSNLWSFTGFRRPQGGR